VGKPPRTQSFKSRDHDRRGTAGLRALFVTAPRTTEEQSSSGKPPASGLPDYDSAVTCAASVLALVESPASVRTSLAIAFHLCGGHQALNVEPELFDLPSISPASGAIKTNASKPVIHSHRSTAGSPKASTRRSRKTPRRCSTSWRDAMHSVGENVRRSDVDVRLVSDRPLIGHLGGTPSFGRAVVPLR
jgi:hypothetical protein